MSLKELVRIDNRFEKSVNLLLDLNSNQKIGGYIPTRSSINILSFYLNEVSRFSGNHATILVGPYGKGKSHLLLVLLALLSKHQGDEMADLLKRIKAVSPETDALLDMVTNDPAPMLPVIINTTGGDLSHAFHRSLTLALDNAGLADIIPDSIYTEAIKAIKNWKANYPGTYSAFCKALGQAAVNDIIRGLENYEYDSYLRFRELYPTLTSGAQFNPNVDSEVISVYRSVNRKLKQMHGYKGIFIVFDEFSKYIEGHEESSFANDMKVLQDICELANASQDEQLHIVCVAHKSIRSYGNSLPKSVINAFEGVEGRLKEVFFTISSKNNYELISDVIEKRDSFYSWASQNQHYKQVSKESFELRNFSSLFTPNDYHKIVAEGCFPLTPVASMLLLSLSEKIAQNERTLFTFITGKDRSGLERIISRSGTDDYIGVDRVFDYFLPLFSDGNEAAIHHEWLKADFAISKTNNSDAQAIIKAMAVISMVNTPDELPVQEKQLRLSLGMPESRFNDAFLHLVQENLIEYKNRTRTFEFKNNIGIDLEAEIADCIKKKYQKYDVCAELDRVNRIHFVMPKKHNQSYCTTRFFNLKFLTSQQFLKLKNRHLLKYDNLPDGVIILILPGEFSRDELISHLTDLGDTAIVMLLPDGAPAFEPKIQELLAIQHLRSDEKFIDDNRVVFRELLDRENDLYYEINELIRECYFREHTVYTYKGALDARTQGLNRIVSDLCDETYPLTPIINHELINRNNISPAITKARAILISDMLKGENLSNKYAEATSAEATICRATLFKSTDAGLASVGNVIDRFIADSISKKQKFSLLINQLTSAPYGMRKGSIPLYLADHLLKLHGIPIIYLNNNEVTLDPDVFTNILRSPDNYYLLVEEESVQKEEYIATLSQLFSDFEIYCHDIDHRNQLAKTACLMQSWYRSLPQAAKTFTDQDLPSTNMNEVSAFRKLFSNLYLNPHEILFEKLPLVFGSTDYKEISKKVEDVKRQLEIHVALLKERTTAVIREEFKFPAEGNLAKLLNDWYGNLSDTAKSSVLSSKAVAIRKYASEVKTFDDFEISGKIAKEITGTYIEDWKPGMENDVFRHQLSLVLDEFAKLSTSTSDRYSIISGSEGQQLYIPACEKLSSSGHFLKNALDDLFDEYGTRVSNEEKVSILMSIIQEMIE